VNEPAARVLREYHFKWKSKELQSKPVVITGWDQQHNYYTFDQEAPKIFIDGIITAIMHNYTLSQRIINALWAVTPNESGTEATVGVVLPHCREQRILDLKAPSLGLPIAPTIFYPKDPTFKAFDIVLCYSVQMPALTSNTNTNTNINAPDRCYRIQFIQCSLMELYYHEKDSERIKKAFGLRKCLFLFHILYIS
jgi:hypothetical protein